MPRLVQKKYEVLHLPERSPVPSLLRRLGVAVGLILAVSVMLWFGREGLHDQVHDKRVTSFVDVFYFTVITLTTVGYGDIVPATPAAKLVNAVLLTPVRLLVLALFLGTAYELILQRYRERVYMGQLQQRLNDHTIVCGFGVKGRSIVNELLAHGHKLEDIIIIEPEESAVAQATSMGLTTLRGDASSEAILQAAAIEKASHILIAPHRDDQCVLICLTVRALTPDIRMIAAAREEENIKLLYSAGADVVVASSVAGGRLMSAAVRQKAVTQVLQDLLVFGEGMDIAERNVKPTEAGLHADQLKGMGEALILGVARGNVHCPFHKLKDWPLQAGDVVIYLTGDSECVVDVEA